MNICPLYEGAPVVLALFVDADGCPDVLKEMQALVPVVSPRPLRGRRDQERPRGSAQAGRRSCTSASPSEWIAAARSRRCTPSRRCPQVSFMKPGGVVQSPALLQHPLSGAPALTRQRARSGIGAERRMSGPEPPEPVAGWQAPEIERELPGLRLLISEVEVRRPAPLTGDSPPDIEARLRELSSRVRGARAITLRREPVPAAYRVFFRHIGMDPDVERTPIEAAVMERMLRGRLPDRGPARRHPADRAARHRRACLGARRRATSTASLGIRVAADGEPLGRDHDPPLLPAGRLVVADAARARRDPVRSARAEPSAAGGSRRLVAVRDPGPRASRRCSPKRRCGRPQVRSRRDEHW